MDNPASPGLRSDPPAAFSVDRDCELKSQDAALGGELDVSLPPAAAAVASEATARVFTPGV